MKKYESEVRVIFADTDAMGIVYHVNYIKWFEVGRTEYLRQIGFAYSGLEREGIWLPLAEVNIKYKLPAVYDDVLLIRTWVKDLKAATVVMAYEIVRKETEELLVTGTTKHAITDSQLKPIALKKVRPDVYDRIAQDMKAWHDEMPPL